MVNRKVDVFANADGGFTVKYMEKRGAVYHEVDRCNTETFDAALDWGRDYGKSEVCAP
jgi:hypothetical protein